MSSIPVQIGASIQGGRWLTHAQSQAMGGRYHQKYMNFKRYRQERDGSSAHYKIAQVRQFIKSGTAKVQTVQLSILE